MGSHRRYAYSVTAEGTLLEIVGSEEAAGARHDEAVKAHVQVGFRVVGEDLYELGQRHGELVRQTGLELGAAAARRRVTIRTERWVVWPVRSAAPSATGGEGETEEVERG